MPADPLATDESERRSAGLTRSGATELDGMSRVWRVGRTAWALIGILGILVLTSWVAGRLSLIVIPLILALFPATLLVPVAAALRARGVPSSLAAIAAMLLAVVTIGGLIGGMVALVISEGPELVESASSGVEQIEQFLQDDPLGLGIEGPAELFAAAREQLGEIGDYAGQAAGAATAATEFLTGLVLLFVILFFYLKDGRRLARGVVSVAPAGMRARLTRAGDRAWETLGSYFRGQLTVAFVDAVFIGIGLLILGIPLAIPLAVLIFFGALFPLVGALITGGLAVLVGLADGGLGTALIVLALIVVVQQVEGNVLQPIIIGRATALHPLVVILAITAGAVLLGILGAFLAVPVAAIVARVLSDGDDGPDDAEPRDERVAPDAGTKA